MTAEDHDLCVKGLQVLTTTLGVVEAERFVMLMNRDAGDYTEWRRTNLYQDESLEELAEKARQAGETIRFREKVLARLESPKPARRPTKRKRASARP